MTSKQIIDIESNSLILDKDSLKRILFRDEIRHKNIVVVSIAGTFRQGKSFILNFFLRFLKATCRESRNVENWLNSNDGPLEGFKWTASSRRETIGIVMWSEIFLSQLPSGEEVAIVLLDTQGTFDNQTAISDGGTLFALSTLLSSVQIFNVKDNIRQNELLHLKDFLEYGRLANEENSTEAPFQKFLFLIRDWSYPNEHNYGADGGEDYLDRELSENENDPEEVAVLKRNLRQCFSCISAYLLPHPGQNVVLEGTANLDEMNEDFVDNVKTLVTEMLKPDNLVCKQINGVKIKVQDWYQLVKKYWEKFESGDMPDLSSIYEATAEVQLMSLLEECIVKYKELMNITEDTAWISNNVLLDTHITSKNHIFDTFNSRRRMGNSNLHERYEQKLEQEIYVIFTDLQNINRMKQRNEQQENERNELQRQINRSREQVEELRERLFEVNTRLQNTEQSFEREKQKRKQLKEKLEEFQRKQNGLDEFKAVMDTVSAVTRTVGVFGEVYLNASDPDRRRRRNEQLSPNSYLRELE